MMHVDTPMVTVTYIRKEAETPRAYLLVFKDHGEVWIPKSHVEQFEVNDDFERAVVMTAWIAEKKGLVDPKDEA